MKNKKVARLLSLLLTMMLLLSACGKTNEQQGEESSKGSETQVEESQSDVSEEKSAYPEYLNMDSAYPVIKDEYAGKVKPRLAIVLADTAKEWDELWISKYFKEKYNMEFDVEVITNAALEERKSLMLNSGDMPDIMINMWFTTAELVKYGQQEGVLLAMDEYMNEELTPNILLYQETLANYCTAPDGHVYTTDNNSSRL